MRLLQKTFVSFRNALHGLLHAYRKELSFRMEVWAGLVLVFAGYLLWPLKEYEILFLVLSYALVLAFELVNTALERMFERLHPEHHELVGLSKDLASAAVFVSVLFCGAVVIVLAISQIF